MYNARAKCFRIHSNKAVVTITMINTRVCVRARDRALADRHEFSLIVFSALRARPTNIL